MIETKRLILRNWCEEDLAPFAQLNSDPKVMEYFPSTLTKEESDNLAKRLQMRLNEKGLGCFAVCLKETNEFIGFIGLNSVEKINLSVHFAPTVEIGWRLSFLHWGKGYATEGALASLQYGFETLQLKEIVSFTAKTNLRSQSVMKKIGMHHNPQDDFEHPKIPEGHPLRIHVLYRLKSSQWIK